MFAAETNTINSGLKMALRQALVLGALGMLLGLGVNALRPGGLPLVGTRQGNAGLAVISVDAAAEHFKSGGVLFLDARAQDAYLAGHIPGALNVPPPEAGSALTIIRELSGSRSLLIVYCDGEGCRLGDQLASMLAELGVSGVAVMPAGWEGWVAAGLPAEALP